MMSISSQSVVSLAWTLTLFVTSSGWAESPQEKQFTQLVDDYFDAYFAVHPSQATQAGIHDFDDELEDYSPARFTAEAASLREFGQRCDAIDAAALGAERSIDWEMVRSDIRARLLWLEESRSWERSPDFYSGGITRAAFELVGRRFAPPADRLRSVIARERKMPQALAHARQNLTNPPRIHTEIALEQLPGMIRFFQSDLPAAFEEVRDTSLLAEFHQANRAVLDALAEYQQFLRADVLPRSNGDFRIGAERLRKKLLYEEMIDIPLDRLLEVGWADLRDNQAAFAEAAARIDARRTPREVLAVLEKDRPAPDQLLASFQEVLDGLREFVVSRRIATIPSRVPPILQETPPFKRATSWASMDTPGPFERHATEAFFNVTLPEAHWSKERTDSHMAAFHRPVIISTAIHETYPGHYVQFLWVQRAPSKVRQLLGCASNSEGWAHYTEEMMLEQGYGQGDPKLRLGQLQDALLRNARFIVAIQMHTGKMTYDEAIEFFVQEGYQTWTNAEREVKRGTSNPTYLVYTLGKLCIHKLRDDYQQMRGKEFTLLEFHDNLLKQGYPPLKLVRRALLGSDGSLL